MLFKSSNFNIPLPLEKWRENLLLSNCQAPCPPFLDERYSPDKWKMWPPVTHIQKLEDTLARKKQGCHRRCWAHYRHLQNVGWWMKCGKMMSEKRLIWHMVKKNISLLVLPRCNAGAMSIDSWHAWFRIVRRGYAKIAMHAIGLEVQNKISFVWIFSFCTQKSLHSIFW